MKDFIEYEFQTWIEESITATVLDNYSKSEFSINDDDLDSEVQNKFHSLTAFELVCYLGEYLTKDE